MDGGRTMAVLAAVPGHSTRYVALAYEVELTPGV